MKYFALIVFLMFFVCCNQVQNNQKHSSEIIVDKEKTKEATPVEKPLLGIDVSHFQGNVNWADIKKYGISFSYSKATQGSEFKDPKFIENCEGSQKEGILHGAYHFYVAADNPEIQAQNFIDATKFCKDKCLVPVLDLEEGGLKGNIDINKFQSNVQIWLNQIEKEFGTKPIIYTDNPFANKYLVNEVFGEYHLWIAEYGVTKPKTPTIWEKQGWKIWQRSDRGTIEGAIGNVDHDLLRGVITDLQK